MVQCFLVCVVLVSLLPRGLGTLCSCVLSAWLYSFALTGYQLPSTVSRRRLDVTTMRLPERLAHFEHHWLWYAAYGMPVSLVYHLTGEFSISVGAVAAAFPLVRGCRCLSVSSALLFV